MHGRDGDPHSAYGIAFRFRVAGSEAWRPALEVYETATALVIRVELAGIDAEALAVALDGDTLTIEGQRLPDAEGAAPAVRRQYHEMGIPYGPFRARVRLPFPVAREAVEAEYEHGFLTVRLPRAARVTIPAQTAGATTTTTTTTVTTATDDVAAPHHTARDTTRKGKDTHDEEAE